MTDLELVIKISEESYKATCNGHMLPSDVENVVQGIKNGIQIPKGHGRLIDEKEIEIVVNDVFSGYKCSPKFFLNVIHKQCIEAVGADRTESEDKE